MHYAAAVGSLAVVKLLIEKGYRNQVNVKDKWGDTPVHKAAASSSRGEYLLKTSTKKSACKFYI